YPWPGNVRELRNVIERGLVFAFGEELLVEHLPPEFQPGANLSSISVPGLGTASAAGGAAGETGAVAGAPPSEPVPLSEMERRHIEYVLQFVKGNKLKAAALLGISRTTLYEKLKQYELSDAEEEKANP